MLCLAFKNELLYSLGLGDRDDCIFGEGGGFFYQLLGFFDIKVGF